jgi:tetratricopeptide (TPR) repeat protein
LAVFDLPVAAKAIGYLLEPWFPDLDPRRCLPRLVASYFVSTTPPKREFNLRSLDRDYVYRQLPGDAGESDYGRRNLELRAADFYASARKPENEWRTIGDLAPQLREFEHRIRAEDHDGAYQVLAPIGRDYLYKWGHWSQLADMHAKLRGKPMSPQSQAANSGNMGRVCRALGQTTLAVELYKEALDYARQTRDRKRESVVLGSLGNAYLELWQFGQAIPSFLEALAIAGQAEDREQEGRHLGNLGLAYYLQGRVEQAIGHFEDALDIARETSNPVSEGGRLGNLGKAYLSLGQIPLATHRLEEALTIALETGNRRQEGVELCNLGMVRQALGQPQRAILLYEQALDIAREIGYRAGEERYLSSLASAYRDTGQIQEAEDYYRDALAIAREIDDYRGRSYQLLGMAQLSLAKGLFQDARAYCEQALTPDVPETSYRVALTLGIAYLCQHDRDAGNAFHDAAIRSQAMLDKTADLYKARYALAAARVGQAVCDQRWTKASDRSDLLASVLDEYRSALNNCSAKGAVQDARRDLELIEKAGIDGLEPVFELLEEHIGD